MAATVTGVDVGSRSAIFLRGKPTKGSFALTGFWAAGHRAANTRDAWSAARPDFKPGASCVGLSGREVNLRYSQVPRLPDWQLEKLMRFEVEEIGGQAGAEMAADFNVLPELPEVEGEDVVLLAMAREESLEEHDEGLAAVGGRLLHFTPDAIALYNAWLHYGVVEEDTVLVANVGHQNIDVVIVRGTDLLFARNLSGGSQLFDQALAERFGVPLERAESIKVAEGSLAPDALRAGGNREKAAQALQGAAGQVLSLLQSAILYCKTQIKLSGLSVDRVALAGGGAQLDGFDRWLETAMKVRVERFDPFRVVDTSALDARAAANFEEFRARSVIALGLATGASLPEAYAVEILPERVRRRRELWGARVPLIAAALVALLFLGHRANEQRAALERTSSTVARLESELRRARRADQETRDLHQENAALAELTEELWLAAGSGEQAARLVGLLERELPADFWLSELRSGFGPSSALGIERGNERPVLFVEGRVREGTLAPSALFESFLARLEAALPGLLVAPSLAPAGDRFTLELTWFGPVPGPDGEVEG